jgi:hypothetical protein
VQRVLRRKGEGVRPERSSIDRLHEPNLWTVISDPIVKLLMARDSASEVQLTALLQRARRAQQSNFHTRPPTNRP